MSSSTNGMKCPVCGYLNDPEDVECIACGSDMALSAESIAIEKQRSKEAMERYRLQQEELRRELGIDEPEEGPLVMAREEETPAASEPGDSGPLETSLEMESIPSDFYSDVFLCPQCGFRNAREAIECVRCGVIFSKLKGMGDKGVTESSDLPGGTGPVLDDLGEAPLDTGTGYSPYVPGAKLESRSTGEKVKAAWRDVDLSGKSESALKGLGGMGTRMKAVPPKWYGLALGVVLLLVALPFAWKGGLLLKSEWAQRSRVKLEASLVDEFTGNRAAIGAEVRAFADSEKFEEARAVLDRFDIEPLQAELEPLKRYLEEKETYARVLAVPAWKFETNYTLFSRLVALSPSNTFYRSKQEFYKKRLAGQCHDKALRLYQSRKNDAAKSAEAVSLIEKAVGFYPKNRAFKELRAKVIYADLLYYKGNGSLQMALRDEGLGKSLYKKQRKITIWLRNTSDEILYINPDFFTLETRNGKSLKYNNVMETGFQGKLSPGEKTAGVLYFRSLAMPRALTFEHLVAGTIQREFP
ncbi:zinc finger ranbp2-type [Desulfoluna butyratoxydans]|uniref:Zinc finger ranbp2-type n=2 Tax=Desulfoluna butyratoxydans TaxID=231438 RepID=A0A4U8YTU1_9BACT|nr:zinc finger ranbp2-type [Desulfoluna butyratoxydans]